MKQEKSRAPMYGLSRESEEQQLAEVIQVAQNNLERTEGYIKELSEELHEMLETYGAKDKEALTLWHNTQSQLTANQKDLIRCQKARKKPYFGRIDFQDEKLKGEEAYYVGRVGITKDGSEPMVIDWRAPIASVYYENSIGPCEYKVRNEGTYRIDLKRKRTYEIADDRLVDYFDTDVVANDDLLTKYLAKSKKAVLGEIIATIQKEQNAIIRKSPKTNLIVQGVAGSGKTTVAMHRISYILYNYEEFRPQDFYIIGSNRILLDYITSVLPDLDVYGVGQMTMEQLFARLLYEDWNPECHDIRSVNRKDEHTYCKGKDTWFHDLEAFCKEYERSIIPCEEVRIEKNNRLLLSKTRILSYLDENPRKSMQSKIIRLNEIVNAKLENELIGKYVSYSKEEKKELEKTYRFYFGRPEWKGSIFELYEKFLEKQRDKGYSIYVEDQSYDVYDMAALAYLYKRIKESDEIREASHVIIDEAQDFGMMAYEALHYCLRDCTYTIMGDVSQNIYYGYGLNDWEALKKLILTGPFDSFGLLKKSYRNTVEISKFATGILRHGDFAIYPVEPIIRHGKQVQITACENEQKMIEQTATLLSSWQEEGHETIAVICRDESEAAAVSEQLGAKIALTDSNLQTAEFGSGVMVLPIEYTKGLEFDAVVLYQPSTEKYPANNQHVKLLYVAATRALHELAIVYTNELTELIATSVSQRKRMKSLEAKEDAVVQKMEPKVEPKLQQKVQSKAIPKATSKTTPLKKEPIKKVTPKPVVKEKPPEPTIVVRPKKKRLPQVREARMNLSSYRFCQVVDTTLLRPKEPGNMDQMLRSAKKTKHYMELASKYGTLRITPVEEDIVRVQFQKGQTPEFAKTYWEYEPEPSLTWKAKDEGAYIQLTLSKLLVRVDKKTSAIQFLDTTETLLLAEKSKMPRQMEEELFVPQTWTYYDWANNEKLYAKGILSDDLERMTQKARYISFGGKKLRMPLLVSEKGYGLGIAAESTVMCCDISMYGPYVYTEGMEQIDYYFLYGGERENTIELYKMITL